MAHTTGTFRRKLKCGKQMKNKSLQETWLSNIIAMLWLHVEYLKIWQMKSIKASHLLQESYKRWNAYCFQFPFWFVFISLKSLYYNNLIEFYIDERLILAFWKTNTIIYTIWSIVFVLKMILDKSTVHLLANRI